MKQRQLQQIALRACLGLSLAVSGCRLLEPCTDHSGATQREGLMTGTWVLMTVNGQALKNANGTAVPYILPAGQGKLERGSIDFRTNSLDKGTCWNPEKTTGDLVALYVITAGTTTTSKTQAGSFEHFVPTEKLVMTALGQSATGKASPAGDRMDLDAPLPISGSTTYKLHFERP